MTLSETDDAVKVHLHLVATIFRRSLDGTAQLGYKIITSLTTNGNLNELKLYAYNPVLSLLIFGIKFANLIQ